MNKQTSPGKSPKKAIDFSSVKLPLGITVPQAALMLVSVILAALAIYFAVSYFGSVNNKHKLESDVLVKQGQINTIGGPQNITALQSQLEEAQQDLIDQSPFPATINNTDVAYEIIQASRAASITCFEYTPNSDEVIGINGHDYTNNNFRIISEGTAESPGEKITKITRFLEELEGAFDTASISGLYLSNPSGGDLWSFGFTYSILSQ